eukprot:1189104-Prorocentrum_minimum.AAC.2
MSLIITNHQKQGRYRFHLTPAALAAEGAGGGALLRPPAEVIAAFERWASRDPLRQRDGSLRQRDGPLRQRVAVEEGRDNNRRDGAAAGGRGRGADATTATGSIPERHDRQRRQFKEVVRRMEAALAVVHDRQRK